LCLLYPKRSITSHRFCGSGRLFPGLRSEMRRAESDMIGLVVTDEVINSGREQAYLGIIPLSREYCKKCTNWVSFRKSNLPVRSKMPKRVQNGQNLLLRLQVEPGGRQGGGRGEAGGGGGWAGGGSGKWPGGQAVEATERRHCERVTKKQRRASNGSVARFSSACSYETMQERRGVLVGAFQSEREEETRD
jgi:hypothetical protein